MKILEKLITVLLGLFVVSLTFMLIYFTANVEPPKVIRIALIYGLVISFAGLIIIAYLDKD